MQLYKHATPGGGVCSKDIGVQISPPLESFQHLFVERYGGPAPSPQLRPSLDMDTPRSHPAISSVLDAYPVRIMLGLVASLSLMLALVRLPLQSPVKRVGWSADPPSEQIVLEDVTPERSGAERSDDAAKRRKTAPPATDFRSLHAESQTTSASSENTGTESTERDSDDSQKYEEVRSIAELGVTDQTPQIVGGTGSLYLHINYPEEARAQGIEGRLEVEFTVETDGTVADMEVVESLHPLCDSAAVEGVRSVTFVPAKRDGKPIPIRLRLPIRFQLMAASNSVPSNGMNP